MRKVFESVQAVFDRPFGGKGVNDWLKQLKERIELGAMVCQFTFVNELEDVELVSIVLGGVSRNGHVRNTLYLDGGGGKPKMM